MIGCFKTEISNEPRKGKLLVRGSPDKHFTLKNIKNIQKGRFYAPVSDRSGKMQIGAITSEI